MTYSESAEGVMIDRRRARVECARHGICAEETQLCIDELFGSLDAEPETVALIDAADLLRWLGY